ncbi:MAG: hypothetical protein ACTS6A_01900 [Candidatus Hodgkinia cicadicola]
MGSSFRPSANGTVWAAVRELVAYRTKPQRSGAKGASLFRLRSDSFNFLSFVDAFVRNEEKPSENVLNMLEMFWTPLPFTAIRPSKRSMSVGVRRHRKRFEGCLEENFRPNNWLMATSERSLARTKVWRDRRLSLRAASAGRLLRKSGRLTIQVWIGCAYRRWDLLI